VVVRPLPNKILAMDWDARTLRVVHAFLSKRGVKIDRLLSVGIPGDLDLADPQQLGRHIRRVLDQESIATRHAVVDIPRDQAILKTLTLPSMNPDELPGMVAIQIARDLPFPAAEAVVDFAVSPAPDRPQSPATDVLVAVVRRELLEHYEAAFAVAGLKLDRVGLRPYANKVAVCELLKYAMPERVLFIDVRPTLTEINVLRNSALAFSRAASVVIPKDVRDHPQGGEAFRFSLVREAGGAAESAVEPVSALDAVIQSLLVEVTRSIEAYRVDDVGAKIDHVVIAGDVGIEETLAEAIQKRLNLTTELYNPAASFGWEPDEGAGAAAFSATLGLVLGHPDDGSLHFDFLHPKKTVTVTQKRLRMAPIAAAIAILFIAAVGVGFGQYTRPGRTQLAAVEKAIEELEKDRVERKKFLDLMDRLREFDAQQLVWVDVLYDVLSELPTNEEWVLTHAEMNQKDGRLVLKTKAKNRETATLVENRLRAFRREGRERPRFEVSVGPQSEKKGEKYPFVQDLRITVLNDEATKKGSRSGAL